jgi:hypothetical protein
LVAGTLLATTVHFTWLARIGRIDMPLTLCVSVAVLAFHLARPGETKRPWLLLLVGYLAMAAGILLKGPIGLVLPAAVVGVQRLFEGAVPPPWRVRAWAHLVHELGLWWGLPLVLLLTLPWFILVNLRTAGEEFQVFFWYHNVARGLGSGGLRDYPIYYYVIYLFGDYLPWTPLLPVAGWLWWRQGWGRGDPDVLRHPVAGQFQAFRLSAAGVSRCGLVPGGSLLSPASAGYNFLARPGPSAGLSARSASGRPVLAGARGALPTGRGILPRLPRVRTTGALPCARADSGALLPH